MEIIPLQILVVGESEVDCGTLHDLLGKISTVRLKVDCVAGYARALDEIQTGRHDLYLVEWNLGDGSGTDLLRRVGAENLNTPFILLTEKADSASDKEAMQAGATDCVVKKRISAPFLHRCVRYALQQKRTRAALQESEERFRFMTENTGDALYRLRYETMNYDYLGPAIKKLTGYDAEEIEQIGFSLLVDRIDLPHQENVSKEMLVRNRQAEKTDEFRADYMIMRKNGEAVWLRDHSFPWHDETGRLAGSTGILSDVTELKKAEESLKESEKHLRFLSSRLLAVQEEERGRLARELHDMIGQTLVAIKFGVEAAINAAKAGNGETIIDSLKPLVPMAQKSIEEMRKIYMSLRPTILDDFGVLAAIDWLASEFEKLYPDIHIEKKIKLAEKDVPGELKTIIYRIMQEAVENSAKHSKATKVIISLGTTKRNLQLTVKDNGHGFDIEETFSADNPNRGLGLASMRERVKLSGGSFKVKSGKDSGTTVKVAWPKT